MSLEPKNAAEIEAMRKGGKILGEIIQKLINFLEPGKSTWDLEKHAEMLFKEYNVLPGFKGYHGYPNILCTSVNNEVVHSIPNKKPLVKGDILSIDCGVILDDLNTDSAAAIIVGGETDPKAKHFVDTCIRALWAGINQVKPGNRIGDISYAIEQVAKQGGYHVFKDLTGHGIGYKLHEEPYVYNYGKRGTGISLKPGMTLALEPIIGMTKTKIITQKDGWTIMTEDDSLAMQHEHTILVTESGVEVLTLRPGEKML